MKRDMDLIRELLLRLEEEEPRSFPKIEIEGYSVAEICFHMELLVDAGFVEGKEISDDVWQFVKITWEGFEFLDLARSSKIWQCAKDQLVQGGIGLSISILYAALKAKTAELIGIDLE